MLRKHPVISLAVLALLPLLSAPSRVLAQAAPATQPTQAELEKEFEQEMNDVTLAGSYTATGQANPGSDRYTIVKVSKAQGDQWTFVARIQFAGRDVNLPLTFPVKWAGDTPVIEVTDAGIPGLGTYTARVLIYKDHYAGTWQGTGHGGQLWGTIEHNPTTQPAK